MQGFPKVKLFREFVIIFTLRRCFNLIFFFIFHQDFPSAPWFLPFSFGTGLPPENSIVQHTQNLSEDNVNELVAQYDIPYSVVKNFKAKLNNDSKKRISQYEPKLDTVLW